MRNTVLVVLVAMLAAICLAMPGTTAQAEQDTGATLVNATNTGKHVEVANLKCPCCQSSALCDWNNNTTAHETSEHREIDYGPITLYFGPKPTPIKLIGQSKYIILADDDSFRIKWEFKHENGLKARHWFQESRPLDLMNIASDTEPEPTRKWPQPSRV